MDTFTVSISHAGSYLLCLASAAQYPAIATVVANLTVEPRITRASPDVLSAGTTTNVTVAGVNVSMIQDAFFVPAQGPSEAACTSVSSVVTTKFLGNSTLSVQALVRGQYAMCYRALTSTYFQTSGLIQVQPVVHSITATSVVYAGCNASFVVTGSGISASLDRFYLSGLPSCGVVNATLALSTTSIMTAVQVLSAQVAPASIGQFTICYAPSNNFTAAMSYGSVVAASAIAFTDVPLTYAVQFLCALPSTAVLNFSVQVRSGAPHIPIDVNLSATTATIRYLPVRRFITLFVTVAPDSSRSLISVSLPVSPTPFTTMCTQLPTTFTGSSTKQLAEAIFSLMVFSTLNCSTLLVSSSVTPPLLQARNLLTQNPLLLTDEVTILDTLRLALLASTDSIAIARSVVSSALPVMTAYSPLRSDVAAAVLALLNDLFAIVQQYSPQQTAVMRDLILFGVNAALLFGTTFCGAGISRSVGTSSISLNILKTPVTSPRGTLVTTFGSVTIGTSVPVSGGSSCKLSTFPETFYIRPRPVQLRFVVCRRWHCRVPIRASISTSLCSLPLQTRGCPEPHLCNPSSFNSRTTRRCSPIHRQSSAGQCTVFRTTHGKLQTPPFPVYR